jgi:iron complex transport system permease protein
VAHQGPREDEIALGWKIGVVLGIVVLTLAWAPFRGAEKIPFSTLWNSADDTAVYILWSMRIPRVLLAFLAGSALAISGMALQAVCRNPLATPFTLGISSGAAICASVCALQGWAFSALGIPGETILAFLGALASFLILYAITALGKPKNHPQSFLPTGAANCLFLSVLILLIQYLHEPAHSFQMLRWVLGGLDSSMDFHDFWNVFPFAISGCLIVWYLTHELNLLAAGEEFALSHGLDLGRTILLLIFAISLIVGGVTAVCGPIGFVGLIVPHFCRRLVGANHRSLFFFVWLCGGAFLVICDTIARTAIVPAELPVGIITSIMGGAFLLWSSRRRIDIPSQ